VTSTFVFTPDVTKTLVSTSETSSPGSQVQIGELIKYQVKVRIYDSTFYTGVVIRDLLPV
jgi:hypothetical protein